MSRDERPGSGGVPAVHVVSPPGKEVSEMRLSELEARARHWLLGATVLPPRAEVVSLADELAVAATRRTPGARALRLSRLAAELRTRMWRIGHREADASEAIELYSGAAQDALTQGLPDEGCQDALGHAVLTAELGRDPGSLHRELYGWSKIFEKSPCGLAFADGLLVTAAYRPAPAELARLDQQSASQRALVLQRGAAQTAPSAPVVSADETGVVLAPPRSASVSPPVNVVGIEPYGSKDRARVVITLTGPTSYRVGALGGHRLLVDFERAIPSARREIAVGGLVEKVRQTSRPERTEAGIGTRIVLDLAGKTYRRIFYLPEPFRVVIDLSAHSAPGPAPGALRQVSRVALDAGHGGTDPGAVGPLGLREKDVTLDIAHLAAPRLSSELGILTMLTRDDDRMVALDERAARANAFHADLLVSIHCNASENATARGVMSFVLDTTRDEAAALIAARENATSLAASSQVASIASGLRLTDLGARSTQLAELLQHSTMTSLSGVYGDTIDHGVKTAGFFVLLGAEMPSVLFETSFISNPVEERRLSTSAYKQKLADAIVRAVRAYREGL